MREDAEESKPASASLQASLEGAAVEILICRHILHPYILCCRNFVFKIDFPAFYSMIALIISRGGYFFKESID